jgi:hypothetical protein
MQDVPSPQAPKKLPLIAILAVQAEPPEGNDLSAFRRANFLGGRYLFHASLPV